MTFLLRPLKRTLAAAAAAGCLIASAAHAEELEHPVKPFLWKVEGGEAKKPSYLFGTVHVGKGPASHLHPLAAKAFDEATAVHTEAPLDMATQLGAATQMMRKDGKTLSQSIGEDLVKQVDAELKVVNPAFNAKLFEPMKTWAIALMVPMLKLQIDGTKPLDMLLWEKAVKDGKKTAGMQTVAEQLSGFDTFKEEEQITYLKETLRSMREDREAGKDSLQALVDAYITGDMAKVQEEFNKSLKGALDGDNKELGDRLMKKLLDDRNVIMADYIDATIKKSPEDVNFFAAGTGHFMGDNSVRALLEKKGYKVTLVE